MSELAIRTDIAIGVEGCPGGWVAAVYAPDEGSFKFRVVRHLRELVDDFPNVAIGVDIPMGIAESVPRNCDLKARKMLGSGRASSVFPAPDRRILRLGLDYRQTSSYSRMISGKGISQQTYHIMSKIEDADDELTPDLQALMFEVHPELSFWKLAGLNPMKHNKKRTAGFNERRDWLRAVFPFESIPETRIAARSLVIQSKEIGRSAEGDDVLDAIISAWTALRFANGVAEIIPIDPQRDERGLLMQMVF